jgi:hypothetical protein
MSELLDRAVEVSRVVMEALPFLKRRYLRVVDDIED